VSAALDAVKERMNVPWKTSTSQVAALPNIPDTPGVNSSAIASSTHPPEAAELPPPEHSPMALHQAVPNRILSLQHFNKALKEIVPSSSESLTSLTDLRKWNEEFGEGRNSRKSQQVWGRGRFGFIDASERKEEGKVEAIETRSSRPEAR
jgi:hypothetical protein